MWCVISLGRLCFRMCGNGAARQVGEPFPSVNMSRPILRDGNTTLEVLGLP